MEITLPDGAGHIIETLNQAGYEAYAVGGCVRDSLMGREPSDWDITTSASPAQVKGLFRRTVDTGIAHGTVTVLLGEEGYEVTTYRVDGSYNDGRHPANVTFTGSLAEDLKRRDFTINAMAYSPQDGLIDLFGGQSDLNLRTIRCVGNPKERFDEDALRILRAVRFAGQLNFEIEPATREAIAAEAENLKKISAERIAAELTGLITSCGADRLQVMDELGICRVVLPEFASLPEEAKQRTVDGLLALHTLCVPERLTPLVPEQGSYEKEYAMFCFAMLLREAAVPKTALYRLKLDHYTIVTAQRLIRGSRYDLPETAAGMRKAVFELGKDLMDRLFLFRVAVFCASEWRGENPDRVPEEMQKDIRCRAVYAGILSRGECTDLSGLAVTGHDLIEAGIPQGVQLGACLNRLLEDVLAHPEDNQKEILVKLARKAAGGAETGAE